MTPAHKIGSHLTSEALNRSRGRHQPFCSGNFPHDQYHIANLAPEHGLFEEEEFEAKTRPSSISLECTPVGHNDSLDIEISFDVYYPGIPTHEEYLDLFEASVQAARLEAADRMDAAIDPSDIPQEELNTDSLYGLDERFFRRVQVVLNTELALGDLEREASRITEQLQSALTTTVSESLTEYAGASVPLSDQPLISGDQSTTPLSEDEYAEHVEQRPSLSPGDLEWDLQFEVTTNDDEVALALANYSPDGQDSDDYDGIFERFVFNPKIAVVGEFEPYTFELVPEDFRYDQRVWSKGRNCATTSEPSDGETRRVETTAVPRCPVYEFVFNTTYDTDFDQLSRGETIETLEAIEDGMYGYLEAWQGPRREEIRNELELSQAELEQYDSAAQTFEAEIERYQHGVNILKQDNRALRAFRLMNEVNSRQHEFPGWRLFQLVYIVSNLSSIVRRERPEFEQPQDDTAGVLWFPTGGGKTEAYLGLILFNLFYDRLRGKQQGVTAWIRFPLRLLSRQQQGRFLESLLYAEQIRRSDSEFGLDGQGEPFSLGFYVGSHDTPNAIGTSRDRYREAFSESQERLENECQVLETCPLCESEVEVEFDREKNSVFHHCTGDNCIGQIPLYVVDRDIYRYVPSVLLGSLDKIVVSGMQPRFANLLGNLTTKCPIHGYGYSGKCSEHAHCDVDTDDLLEVDTDELYDPAPTLHLIDEVHLLNEELGTFSSHYETLYLTLCEEIHGKSPKVLTSTATIAEYERQMRNLFQKDAVRFPVDGPKRRETFYGHLTDTVQREYVGFMPDNRSHLYAVLDTIQDYHELIRDTRDLTPSELAERAGLNSLDEDEKRAILDLYELSVIYFTSKVDKDRYRENITKHTNAEMRKNGYKDGLIERQLTADTEDPALLETLENPEGIAFEDRVDTVPSTSFIGHGIDVDRFNMMMFYGFPGQTFQYIQASSRVGRQSGVTGFVLDAFNPLGERDVHRYRFFEKMHEYLDRAVEPVPIDRWAKFGIERTFTGIANALLIQYYRPTMWRSETVVDDGERVRANVQKASHLYKLMTSDDYPALTKPEFRALLRGAFGINKETTETRYFASQLETKLNNLWRYWEQNLASMNYPEFPRGEEPMVSLRDIGDSGSITAQYNNQPFIESLFQGGDGQ
ncbi:DEAD/DEAH box helicase family protein [Salinigranum halophilum]|uniref:DEAD/DEAH box helicase family protein n=1 Tax=Salinigranum halophilum TaxID=2565931 RepID=UPI001F414ABC|nr:DEAD/DEAH box helicase family protein [Salinigranum halophilum]